MENKKWLPKILYIGRDHDLEKRVSESFDEFEKYQSVRSSASAIQLIKQSKYDIVLCDEEIFSTEAYEKVSKVELSDLYNYAIQMYSKVTFILLYSKRNTSFKDFQKKNTTTLLFDRQEVSPRRIGYTVHLLNRKAFRSFIVLDIVNEMKAPTDLYCYNFKDGSFVKIFSQGETVKLTELNQREIDRLYFKTEDFDRQENLIEEYNYTKQMNIARKKYKALLSDLVDDYKLHDIANGTRLRNDANDIVNTLTLIIKSVKNINDCLKYFPYSLNTLVTHGLNSCIYSLCLSYIYTNEFNQDLAVAALVHDIGLSFTDFNDIKKNKAQLTIKNKIDIEKHVEYSLQLLNNKLFRSSKIIDEAILLHHETYDGLGFPAGKKLSNYQGISTLLSMIDALDRVLSVQKTGEHKSIIWGIEALLDSRSAKTSMQEQSKFNTEILTRIKLYLLNEKQKKAA